MSESVVSNRGRDARARFAVPVRTTFAGSNNAAAIKSPYSSLSAFVGLRSCPFHLSDAIDHHFAHRHPRSRRCTGADNGARSRRFSAPELFRRPGRSSFLTSFFATEQCHASADYDCLQPVRPRLPTSHHQTGALTLLQTPTRSLRQL